MSTRQFPRDLTRPTPHDARLFRRSSTRFLFFTGLSLLAVIVAALLFIFPIRDYLAQRSSIKTTDREFAALEDANEQLQNDIQRLQTSTGVREAARQELGYLLPGEKRLALLESPAISTVLPESWPFNVVTSILAVRSNEAAQRGAPRPGTLGPLQQP